MARINLKIAKPDASAFRGWTFVVVTGVVLTIIAMVDRGGLDETAPTGAAAGCRVEVSTPELFVRSGPTQEAGVVETLTQGAVVDATRLVAPGTTTVPGGFRQLAEDRWAAAEFLVPLPGTNCA